MADEIKINKQNIANVAVILNAYHADEKLDREESEEIEKVYNFCEWELVDGNENYYETDCGEAFYFTDDGPNDNNMNYCCYCGKPIKEGE